MSIDPENTSVPAAEAPATKGPRNAKKAKPAKKAGRAKKLAGKPKSDRTNKNAEVIHDEARQRRDVPTLNASAKPSRFYPCPLSPEPGKSSPYRQ
jgi:hypothetical protein